MLIHHFLEKSAEVFPDKIAVVCDDTRCTYSEINYRSNNIAAWLTGIGLKNGDRVAVLLNNSPEYVISYYGILKAGGVTASLSSDLKPDQLRRHLHKIGAKVLITSARFERLIDVTGCDSLGLQTLLIAGGTHSWANSACTVYSWENVISDVHGANPVITQADTDLAGIIFTSGSMGDPKGVMLSHANIAANTLSITQFLQISSNDRQMVVLPFHYVMGMSLLNTHISVGGCIIINNRFAFPADVLHQMEQEEVTSFSGVPSTYAYLLHRSPLRSYRDRLEALRYCSQAGGHMSWQVKKDLLDVMPPHTKLYIMYGATEASARLSFVEPERLQEKPDSIGRAIPGVSLRIRDENGRELPVGSIGELVAEGPSIMRGYWQDRVATEAVLGPYGYRTGDLGYQDEDGYFFLVGRKDHQLKVGGHRTDPQEIEDILMATGLLLEATVFGVPDPLLGTRIIALVVPIHENNTVQDILAICSARLPRHKIPSELKFVSALPKNSSGKLDSKRCHELLGFKEPTSPTTV